MRVRQFNAAGIKAFQAFLAQGREQPETAVPRELLEDDALATLASPAAMVEPQAFVTKGDAATYLKDALSPIPEYDAAMNAGLWTWLALFYFDQICPPKGGRRVIRNDYHYVFEPKNSRHFYRHLLFISWRVLCVAPVHNRLFLGTSISSLDKVTTEVMKRLYLTRIPCIFEVLDRIYWDDARGKARVGITDMNAVKPGDLVHRLPLRVRQLERTYDLQSLPANQLIELLGDEFRQPAIEAEE